MKSLFEQLGGTYTRQGDYCLPDVRLPPEEEPVSYTHLTLPTNSLV